MEMTFLAVKLGAAAAMPYLACNTARALVSRRLLSPRSASEHANPPHACANALSPFMFSLFVFSFFLSLSPFFLSFSLLPFNQYLPCQLTCMKFISQLKIATSQWTVISAMSPRAKLLLATSGTWPRKYFISASRSACSQTKSRVTCFASSQTWIRTCPGGTATCAVAGRWAAGATAHVGEDSREGTAAGATEGLPLGCSAAGKQEEEEEEADVSRDGGATGVAVVKRLCVRARRPPRTPAPKSAVAGRRSVSDVRRSNLIDLTTSVCSTTRARFWRQLVSGKLV